MNSTVGPEVAWRPRWSGLNTVFLWVFQIWSNCEVQLNALTSATKNISMSTFNYHNWMYSFAERKRGVAQYLEVTASAQNNYKTNARMAKCTQERKIYGKVKIF